MQDFDSNPSQAELMNPKEERQMRETLRDIFATSFPNPNRHDCPDSVKVKALAWRRKFPEAQEIISHLGSCSPCYGEHEEFVRKYKSRQVLYRLAAAAVLLLGVGVWVSWRFLSIHNKNVPELPPVVQTPREPLTPAPRAVPPPVLRQKPPEIQAALDLRERGATRGETTKGDGDLLLPRGRLKLSIYLPIGSDEGDYEVRISGRGQSLNAKGRASVKNRITVLTVNTDTGTFESGRYNLAIRQTPWGWYRYSVWLK